MKMFLKAKFINNSNNIFQGVFVANIISFLANIVLSRIYNPEDFATFALYTQIIGVMLITSGGSIFLIIPKREKIDNSNLLNIVLILSVINLIFFFLINNYFKFIDLNYIFVILGLLFSIIYSFLHISSITYNDFRFSGNNKVYEKIIGTLSNILLGLYFTNKLGLIIGNYFGQFTYIFNFIFFKKYKIFKSIRLKNIFSIIKKKYKFLISQSTSHLIEVSHTLLFSILIVQKLNLQELGYLYFLLRIIGTPLTILSDYLSQLSLARISELKGIHHKRYFIKKFIIILSIISTIIVLIFYNKGADIFNILFGKKWILSGYMSEEYIIGLLSIFIFRSVQYLLNSIDMQHLHTYFSLILYIIPIVLLINFEIFNSSLSVILVISSISMMTVTVFYILIILIVFRSFSK